MRRPVAASSEAIRARRQRRSRARVPRWTLVAATAAVAALLVVPLFFAGSPDRLATGASIAGVDVGGLTTSQAQRLLERRAAQLERVPVELTVAGRRFRLSPHAVSLKVDWHATVAAAADEGGGVGILRGYRRIGLKLFPSDIRPHAHAWAPALEFEIARIARAVDQPRRNAALVRRGLHITIAPGATGRALDKTAARGQIVEALASFSRLPVPLPVAVTQPAVTMDDLASKQQTASRIVAAPVTLVNGPTRLRVPRWRLATLLDLGTLSFTGQAADDWFARLNAQIGRKPKDADFAVGAGNTIRVVPARPGIAVDVRSTAANLLAAAKRPVNRTTPISVQQQAPKVTTKAAQAMGITGVVGTFETFYGGVPNRIHNVQLVAHLIDRKLVAPGATFSFNATTGERTAAKGFLEAPVIVNGELQTGLGGGVCQVSTTVFNAAYQAGLPITARTNHALYISHYPLGRDATVDYPDIDLKFVNDTKHWLLLRTFVGSSSLTVTLFGAPQDRRVETTTAPLRYVAAPKVQKTVDMTLKAGQVVVDDPGVPAQSTSVERKVYAPDGRLLSDATWYSSYISEPKIVRVGPKKKKLPPTETIPFTTTPDETAPTAPH
jgi:vancomycin resistance protein YoaR